MFKEAAVSTLKKPYKLNDQAKIAEVRRVIEGVQSSAWASPLVVVPTKGGGIRA